MIFRKFFDNIQFKFDQNYYFYKFLSYIRGIIYSKLKINHEKI